MTPHYPSDADIERIGRGLLDRTLPRPDTTVYLYLLLCFIPGVNYVMLPFAFLWIPHSFFLYAKALRMRLVAGVPPRSSG